MGMNNVIIDGNLTRDPELRYLESGTAVVEFGLASNRKYKDKEETCFVDVTVWAKQAELAEKWLKKGSQVTVEGRLDHDRWEKDGVKRSKHFVTADRVHFRHNLKEQAAEAEETPETPSKEPDF